MKRIHRLAGTLLLLSTLLLCACSGGSHPMAHLAGELSFTAHLSLAGETYLAEVKLGEITGEERNATLVILSPSSIAGTVFKKEGEKITASLNGYSAELAHGDLFSFLELFHITLPLTDTRSENGEKTYVFSDKESRHTVTVKDGATLPARITRESPAGVLSIEILP